MAEKKNESVTKRKEKLDEELKTLQKSLYELEETYLEDTTSYGNVVKGWDGFLSIKDPKPSHHSSRKPKVNDKDREFSLSSVTFQPDRNEMDTDGDDGSDALDIPKGGNINANRRASRKKYSKYNDDDEDFLDD